MAGHCRITTPAPAGQVPALDLPPVTLMGSRLARHPGPEGRDKGPDHGELKGDALLSQQGGLDLDRQEAVKAGP